MIDQDLIDRCEYWVWLDEPEYDWSVIKGLLGELIDNHKKLIESNAELHKELAKLRGDSEQMQNKE